MAIQAVAESADFSPSYEGESFVTVTLRIPSQAAFGAGLYSLEFQDVSKPTWAQAIDALARERSIRSVR